MKYRLKKYSESQWPTEKQWTADYHPRDKFGKK